MASFRPRLAGLVGASVIVAGVLVGGAALVIAKSGYPGATCSGGSVAPGNYDKLTITGVCFVDEGTVNVGENVDIKPGAELVVAFAGDNLLVGDNINVGAGAVLVLGCEPDAFDCLNPAAPSSGIRRRQPHREQRARGDRPQLALRPRRRHQRWRRR